MVHSAGPSGNRTLALLLAFALLFGPIGCMEIEQAMVLGRDGSLTVHLEYSVDEVTLPALVEGQRLIEQWQGQQPATSHGKSGSRWILSPEGAASHFAGPGIELLAHRVRSVDGRRQVTVQCRARDGRRALADGLFGDFAVTKRAPGHFALRAELVQPADSRPNSEEAVRTLAALCRGLRIRLQVETPTDIVSTTGKRDGRRRVAWEFHVQEGGEIEFLRRPPEIEVVFEGAGLSWE